MPNHRQRPAVELQQFVSWHEWKRVALMPDAVDMAALNADFEAFASRYVSGRIYSVRIETVDGFTELTIEYQPIATAPCADCPADGLTERATERLADGTLLCAMHDHHRTMLARGRGIGFSDDPTYWAGWFRAVAPHSELARDVLDSDLI